MPLPAGCAGRSVQILPRLQVISEFVSARFIASRLRRKLTTQGRPLYQIAELHSKNGSTRRQNKPSANHEQERQHRKRDRNPQKMIDEFVQRGLLCCCPVFGAGFRIRLTAWVSILIVRFKPRAFHASVPHCFED